MNFLYIIGINLLVITLIITGILKGKRYGAGVTAIKGLFTIGIATGLAFLNPILFNELSKLSIVSGLGVQLLEVVSLSLYSIVTLITILLSNTIVNLIVNKSRKNKVRTRIEESKPRQRVNRAVAKDNMKTNNRLEKLAIKKGVKRFLNKKISKIFGAFVGALLGLILGFVIYLPISSFVKTDLGSSYSIYELIPQEAITEVINVVRG